MKIGVVPLNNDGTIVGRNSGATTLTARAGSTRSTSPRSTPGAELGGGEDHAGIGKGAPVERALHAVARAGGDQDLARNGPTLIDGVKEDARLGVTEYIAVLRERW